MGVIVEDHQLLVCPKCLAVFRTGFRACPRDGETLFTWTDPPLPAGWHGVGAGKAFGPGTWVRVVAD